jgi:hypothetical protein
MLWRIRVTFSTHLTPREWISPDIRTERPGWGDQVFPFLIDSIEIHLDQEQRLVLAGMERYNFFVEGVSVLGSGRVIPQAFHLLGKLPHQETVSKWTVSPGARLCHEYKPWGQEYHGTQTSGWKPGAVGAQVVSRFIPSSIASMR